MAKETVLFICLFNSVRSRIAEGLLAVRCGEHYEVRSAGIAPAPISPFAAEVLYEIGITILNRQPTSVTAFRGREFDYIVTLCDHAIRANVPLPAGKKMFHQAFFSPCEVRANRDEILADFRKLRDRIDTYLAEIFPDYPQSGIQAGTLQSLGRQDHSHTGTLTGKAGGNP